MIDIELEIKRGFVSFAISNPGNLPAQNLQFEFPQGMNWRKESGSPKILQGGIQFFPPSRAFRFLYNDYLVLLKKNDDAAIQFEVNASYFHPQVGQRVNEAFYFDLLEFKEAVDRKTDIEILTYELTKSLKSLLSETKKIERRLDDISNVTPIRKRWTKAITCLS